MFLHSGTIHALSGPLQKGARLIFQFDVEILYSLKEFQSLLFSFPSFLILRRDLRGSLLTLQRKRLLLSAIVGIPGIKKLLWEASLYALVLELYALLFRSSCPADAGVPRKRDRRSLQPSGKSSLSGKISGGVPVSEPESFLGDHPGNGGILRRFSKFHFSRLFKDFVGMSFSQYVTMQRVHKAKLLLLTTQASITDIAMEAGFNSSSTFNRVFYQYEKMSPTDFRQSHAKLKN